MKSFSFIHHSLLITFISILLLACGGSDTPPKNDNTTPEVVHQLEVSTETVDINGVQHFIKKVGTGEPLLVLHGGPGLFHDYLVPHFEKLAQDYQVIFYDQRGCGQTAFPQDTASITTENYINDLESIRAHLKIDQLHIAGHSWGAILAIHYAKKHPEHLKNLVLISPAPSTSEYFDMMFKNMQKKRSDEDTKELVKLMSSRDFEKRVPTTFKKAIMLGDKVNLADQSTVNELYNPMNFTEASANNLLLVNSMMEKNFFDYNITEGMDSIKNPTLIIVGDLDNVPFASSQLLQDHLPNARLEVLKSACHYPFFEASKAFNRSVDNFLNPEYEE